MGERLLYQLFDPNYLVGALLYAALFVFVGVILSAMVRRALDAVLRHDRQHVDEIALTFLTRLALLLMWVLLVLFYAHLIPALSRLGTALLAGVSVVSVILGFAAQATLGNLVAGISLVLYRPFGQGDRLQVNTPAGMETGNVETISLGYTVLRTDDGRRIIVANSAMAQQTVVKLPPGPSGPA